jgi:hypothetical protein
MSSVSYQASGENGLPRFRQSTLQCGIYLSPNANGVDDCSLFLGGMLARRKSRKLPTTVSIETIAPLKEGVSVSLAVLSGG